MKTIYLKKLTLSNFRGQNHEVEFGDTTVIKGRNGCGKSTLMHGFYYLLSSYTSAQEVKNNNLFDNKVELTKDTPKAVVEAVVEIDGYEYSLKKVAEAKFVRKRGLDNVYEKASSDTYTLYIDNIETSVSDFNAWVERNICPVDMIPYLLDGSFFANLVENDKGKSRKVLENIIGEVKEEDMKGDYSCIKEDLKRFTLEQLEERTKNEMKPLKARMAEIPAIIDSKQATLAEYEQIDYDSLLKEIESKKADIEQIDASILGQGKAIEPIMGERNRIYDLINDKSTMLYDAKIVHNNREMAKVSAVKARLDEAKRGCTEVLKRNEAKKANHEAMVRDLAAVKLLLFTYEQTREKLLAERDIIKARVFTEESCAYCGQELPYEKQEEARERFNAKKQKDLEDVVARGKANNVSIENHKEKITYLEAEIAKGYTLEEIPDTLALETEYKEVQSAFVPFESTSEYARLSKEIDDLKATLPAIPTNDNDALTNAKRMLIGELETLNRRYGLKAKADSIREEIEMHRNEQRTIGSEIARLEGKIDKCKEYAQEKADIISYRVNGKMNDCKIEMWSAQKDGTMIPDVVIKGKNGVKYSTLNFSDRIKTCIELQRLFMEKYEVSLPIWIDEAAVFSSDNMPSIEGQSVLLYASEDMYLTYEKK